MPGTWFHGFSQVRLPPRAQRRAGTDDRLRPLGRRGGRLARAALPRSAGAATSSGTRARWARGARASATSPTRPRRSAAILDVRPVMVRSMADDQPWNWTHNVGGGDFFRLFDAGGQTRLPAPDAHRLRAPRALPDRGDLRGPHRRGHRALGHRQPRPHRRHRARHLPAAAGCARKPMDFSRFVIFQIGADTYSYTGERKMALGNETGPAPGMGHAMGRRHLSHRAAWNARAACRGSRCTKPSRAGTKPQGDSSGAWANRGIVIRSWKARLGGKPAAPWMAEHGVKARGADTSTRRHRAAARRHAAGARRLRRGHHRAPHHAAVRRRLLRPQRGPARRARRNGENTWRMIHREAVGNDRRVEMKTGTLEGLHPAVRVARGERRRRVHAHRRARLRARHLHRPHLAPRLTAAGSTASRVDQSVHGNDFWQTDYDPATQRWSQTYNLPIAEGKQPHTIRLSRRP